MPDMINETAKVRFGMASTRELEIEVGQKEHRPASSQIKFVKLNEPESGLYWQT